MSLLAQLVPPTLFFFNDTATTEIYTLSLHDALPIFAGLRHRDRADEHRAHGSGDGVGARRRRRRAGIVRAHSRSEEHTSELQSRRDLVCRLLLEKKKKKHKRYLHRINDKPPCVLV